MGRHTKLMEDLRGVKASVEESKKNGGLRWVGRVPLLPMLALVVAIALVGYAWTTKQISLNFAGAAPPQAKTPSDRSHTSGARASRGASRQNAVAVTFRVTSSTAGGFRATATLANHGAKPVKGWTLVFRIPKAKMIGASGAVLLKSAGSAGSPATFRGASVIAPGKAVRLVFTGTGQFTAPSGCRLVGVLCRVA
ncbi:MAG: cellulose-binding family [Actinomycetia bacterium]|nr:cellulose-binding family [Actinomycetes bacterium]